MTAAVDPRLAEMSAAWALAEHQLRAILTDADLRAEAATKRDRPKSRFCHGRGNTLWTGADESHFQLARADTLRRRATEICALVRKAERQAAAIDAHCRKHATPRPRLTKTEIRF